MNEYSKMLYLKEGIDKVRKLGEWVSVFLLVLLSQIFGIGSNNHGVYISSTVYIFIKSSRFKLRIQLV